MLVDLAPVMYWNDMGLLQDCSGTRLSLKTLTKPLVLGVLIGQNLQRDSASLGCVERLVHLTHPALAEQSVDLVLAEILADARRHLPVPPGSRYACNSPQYPSTARSSAAFEDRLLLSGA